MWSFIGCGAKWVSQHFVDEPGETRLVGGAHLHCPISTLCLTHRVTLASPVLNFPPFKPAILICGTRQNLACISAGLPVISRISPVFSPPKLLHWSFNFKSHSRWFLVQIFLRQFELTCFPFPSTKKSSHFVYSISGAFHSHVLAYHSQNWIILEVKAERTHYHHIIIFIWASARTKYSNSPLWPREFIFCVYS